MQACIGELKRIGEWGLMMVTDNKATLYSRLAAICFLLFGIDYLFWWMGKLYRGILYEWNYKFFITAILLLGIYSAFSVILMPSKKRRGLLIITVLYTISFVYANVGYNELYLIPEIVACILLFIIIFQSGAGGRMVEERWYLPGVIIILWCFINSIRDSSIPQILIMYKSILITLVKGLGFIFIGLWAKAEAKTNKEKSAFQT